MSFKSIEWTFATGPYHMRSLKIVQGAPVWKKESESELSPEKNKTNWGDLFLWTILLFTSGCGLRWSSGPEAKGNTDSFSKALLKLFFLQAVMLLCLRCVFVFLGGKPAMWLARVLGGSSKVQKACDVMGVLMWIFT
ncbi:hypothetical protein PSTG_05263 [Puccinia striiformis f. sp. tritici PST-78]|uniref:Uncharacterized protein n=1 Tax=Puccinia striiformis f. sp. tritici PST-78 TaxID=1165861 RepID=A0A0L0VQE3_9BASI|nr:hypothetical protein PSTG_05263 [Puccinia striiformis f. sp. tritici PST-78]